MTGSVTRDTGTKRTGTASAKIIADVYAATFLQSVNVGGTNQYTLVAYAYTNGGAVTTADLDLWFNGAEVTTTFTADAPSGWYKLTGTITGVASSVGYGVRVHAGKTVYVDDMSLIGPSPATTVYILNSGAGGVASLNVEGSITAPNFVSNVATGTQPYATTSATKNTNLNADAVDGVNAASMTNGKLVRYNSTGTTIETGTVAESAGALSAITTIGMSGQLTNSLATGTAPLAVTSTTVNANLNADMVDGKHVGTSGNTIPLLDGVNTWSAPQTFTGLATAYVAKTANYTLTDADYTVDWTANNCTGTLPTAVGRTGKVFSLVNSGTGIITVATTSSQTIQGDVSGAIQLYNGENLTVQSNGTNWIIIH